MVLDLCVSQRRMNCQTAPFIIATGFPVGRSLYVQGLLRLQLTWTSCVRYMTSEQKLRFVIRVLWCVGPILDLWSGHWHFVVFQMILKQRANGSKKHMGFIVDTEHTQPRSLPTGVERWSLNMTDGDTRAPSECSDMDFLNVFIYFIFYFINIIFWSFFNQIL